MKNPHREYRIKEIHNTIDILFNSLPYGMRTELGFIQAIESAAYKYYVENKNEDIIKLADVPF